LMNVPSFMVIGSWSESLYIKSYNGIAINY